MRKLLVPVLILVALGVYCSKTPLKEITWQHDLDSAITEGKPVLVDFWRDG